MPGLTYAIGDIHGRLDLLRAAVGVIDEHVRGRSHEVICLGDYVDRGPESRGVIVMLMTLAANAPWRCLMGNHEDMMARSLRLQDTDLTERWLDNGGDATLASYSDKVPVAHLEWLESLPLLYRDAHRLYVHAGVAPGAAIELQDKRALLWIREAFLTADVSDLPCHVVHGHTPLWRMKPEPHLPERLPHRTNLDTGAYFTGILSVGVFDDEIAGGPLEILSITAD